MPPAKRGPTNYTSDELRSLLKKIFRVNPVSSEEWNFVIEAHRDAYPDSQREGQSIRRKLSNLYRQKIPTGDPICPWQVRAAKAIKARMLYKANGGDGHEQYDMSQGYEENTFLSIEEEDLFGEDNDSFPLLPPLGQPTQQPTQEPSTQGEEPTQEPSTQGEVLPGVPMSMTPSPGKRSYRSHVSDRVSRQEFMNKELMSFLEKQADMNRKELEKHAEMNREERQAVVTTISKVVVDIASLFANNTKKSASKKSKRAVDSDSDSDLDFNKKPKANPKAKQDTSRHRHNFAKDDSDSHSSTKSGVDCWSNESE